VASQETFEYTSHVKEELSIHFYSLANVFRLI